MICMKDLTTIDVETLTKLASNLIINKNLDIVDRTNIKDFFMFLTLDVFRMGDVKTAERYIELFERYESMCSIKSDEFHSGFFFTLAQILSLNFDVNVLKDEAIDRKSFEESFFNRTMHNLE